ncbi:LicD family protein [Holdemania filiformis]|uniref:LicD family protein n=1 Tax=Holdemania filiformis TaxID=61171 RepID=UPI00242FDC42|nr:LicD family protein [Holdemania filiformis]
MKKVETLRELQLISIYIYNELIKFCNQHDLKVYLHGGSLIGAIRHKGYIPWDDDIDVCMSRPDYDKLLKISNGKISDSCTLIDPETNEDFNGYIPVIIYNNSKMESKQYRTNEELKIGISIFVYDGIHSNFIIQKIYYAYMYTLRSEHALCRANFNYVNTKIAKKIGPILQRFYKKSDVRKYKKRIIRLQKKYSYNQSTFVSTNADYRSSKEICKKTDFEKAIPLIFEGIESYAYSHYDSHLKKYYGNYMCLPSLDQQNAKHNFIAWIDDSFLLS